MCKIKDAIPNVVLNKLYKYSSTNLISINNIALVNGRPQVLNLKDLIVHFVDHRHDGLLESKIRAWKAEERAYFRGLIIASDNIDSITYRASKSPDEHEEKLMKNFKYQKEIKAIVEMRLKPLTDLINYWEK